MALFRIQMAGVPVLYAQQTQIGEVCGHLWRWLTNGKTTYARPVAQAPLVPLTAEASFLCGIPGIGDEKARRVMAYTGTPAAALHFLTDPATPELPHRPDGFGKETIKNIRSFFGLSDGAALVPVSENIEEIEETGNGALSGDRVQQLPQAS